MHKLNIVFPYKANPNVIIDKSELESKNTNTFTAHLSSPVVWVDIYFTKRGKFKKGKLSSYVSNILVTSSQTLPCSLSSSTVE